MSDSTRRRALLYVNPKARRGADVVREAREALESCGCIVSVGELSDASSLERDMVVRRNDFDIVVVGGGDGTLISTVPALRASGFPLGILPLGTMNDLARSLEIPLDIAHASRVAVDGRLRPIDVGRVNGKYFVNEASLGISTRIARFQTGPLKKRLGLFAVPYTTLLAMRYSRPFHVRVESDAGAARELRAIQVTIGNNPHFGAFITNDDADLDDGKLDFYALRSPHWRQVPSMLRCVMAHRLDSAGDVETDHAVRFTITTRKPHHVFTDGEPATKTPATFESCAAAITVAVPA